MGQLRKLKFMRSYFFQRKLFSYYWIALTIFAFSQICRANVVGNDLQNFNATTNGIDYVTVQASEVLKPGILNLGLMLNYAANTLPYFEAADQDRLKINDSLLTNEFVAGYGLWNILELGTGFSYLLRQKVDNGDASHGKYSSSGLTNIRVNAKASLAKLGPVGIAVAINASRNLVKDNPYLGNDEALILGTEIIGDLKIGPVKTSANLGYRWRDRGKPLADIPVKPTRDQIIGSAALSYLLPNLDTKVVGEVYGSRPTKNQNNSSDRQASSAELLLGIKHDYRSNIAFHFGGGTEMIHGAFSPDWRVYAGINYTTQTMPEKKEEAFVFVNRSEKEDLLRIPNLQFDFNSDKISDGSLYRLQSIFAFLANTEFKRIIVEGHTDSVGSLTFNQKLSERRASAVMSVLVQSGIPADKIARIGYGETLPIADNGNFQGREINRRVEIRIIRIEESLDPVPNTTTEPSEIIEQPEAVEKGVSL